MGKYSTKRNTGLGNPLFSAGKVDWGDDDGRKDVNIIKYFVEPRGFDKLLSGDFRFVIGRKGAGKSAICQFIKLACEHNNFNEYADHAFLYMKDFPMGDIRSLEDKSYTNKSKYNSIWKFLILIELARMICKDQSVQWLNSDSQKFINELMKSYFSHGGFVNTIDVLKKSNSKIGLSSFVNLLSDSEASVLEKSDVHYSKLNNLLVSHIKNIKTSSTYFILMDELDEGWHVSDKKHHLILLGLLSASESVFSDFKGSIEVRPIVALRADIHEALCDSDVNKYDDAILWLQWSQLKDAENSLMQIVSKRVEASIGAVYSAGKTKAPELPYWNMISDDDDDFSIWKFICDRTQERPRDLIKYLKFASNAQDKITQSNVSASERRYSTWLYGEIKGEIHSAVDVWSEIFDCIRQVGRIVIDDEILLKNSFKKNKIIAHYVNEKKSDIDSIFTQLFDFGIIGCRNKKTNYTFFKYRDPSYNYMPGMKIVIHHGLILKLNLR